MTCKGVIREISNYIDGDLDPVVKQELERHLEHCEDCTMIVDQTRKSIKVLCDSRPVSLSQICYYSATYSVAPTCLRHLSSK